MAIAHAATEYVFSDFVLKEHSSENRYKGIRLDLALDKMVTCIAVGLPLLLISLAFAQEVSVGTQISCFSPTKFSWRQAAYVDAYCWAAVQTQDTGGLPLWLHKFFPYVLLLVAVSVYMPALFWRFTGAPVLSSDLTFIMEELDRSYNRAIKLAKRPHTTGVQDSESAHKSQSSLLDLTESFKYPLVEQYLKTKRYSIGLLVRYIICRAVTFLALLLACIYLCYYISLSFTDEFQCNIRSGVLVNDSSVPPLMQCKLVAVGIFRLLSYINVCTYLLLMPWCLYAVGVPFRMMRGSLKPFEMLPTIGVIHYERMAWDDLALYLLFLEENLSELKSYKCLKVIELLKKTGDEHIETKVILRNLGQVKTDMVDGRSPNDLKNTNSTGTEMKEVSPLLQDDRFNKCEDENVVHKRTV
ncbi:Pannexin-1 [Triplophysa tibetana]|uniref:Pannexin-1 n=1 Tax=Triplophysa tibetana TaxID=1572043 RepID=A0A5A9MZG0_9TELE|nr:Pannexin-1 [Triplophysa tibetana]